MTTIEREKSEFYFVLLRLQTEFSRRLRFCEDWSVYFFEAGMWVCFDE